MDPPIRIFLAVVPKSNDMTALNCFRLRNGVAGGQVTLMTDHRTDIAIRARTVMENQPPPVATESAVAANGRARTNARTRTEPNPLAAAV